MSSPFRFRRDKGGNADAPKSGSRKPTSASPKRSRNSFPSHSSKGNGSATIGLPAKGGGAPEGPSGTSASGSSSAQSRQPKNGDVRKGSNDNNSRSSNSTASSNGLRGPSGGKTKKVHNTALGGGGGKHKGNQPPRPEQSNNRSSTPPPSKNSTKGEGGDDGTPPKYPLAMASSSIPQLANISAAQHLLLGMQPSSDQNMHDPLPGLPGSAGHNQVFSPNHPNREQKAFTSPRLKAAKVSVKKAIEGETVTRS
jgi:hypothetical protein